LRIGIEMSEGSGSSVQETMTMFRSRIRRARCPLAVSLLFTGLVVGMLPVLAGEPSSLERMKQKLEKFETGNKELLKPKSVGPVGAPAQIETDVRRQKEDAARSLNETIREQDDRARTRALESGRGVIITQ